jgi:hypothetical protein
MANLDLTPAIAAYLKATPAITNLLGDGANSIIPAFTLIGNTLPADIRLPCIVIKDNGTYGEARRLPFSDTTPLFQVYDSLGAPNQVSYATIDKIVWECIHALDKQSIPTNASYYSAMEIQWDNYISASLFDDKLRLPVKWVRFRAFMVINTRN